MTDASIVRSSFLSSAHTRTFEYQTNSTFSTSEVFLSQPSLLAAGGTLYVAFSKVSIVNSKSTDNTVKIGGALFAYNCNVVHIVGSTYTNNRASSIGEAPFAHNCGLHIVETIFRYNRASLGGVMTTSKSSVNIDKSTF